MNLSNFLQGAVLIGAFLISGAAFADRPEESVRDTKEAAEEAVGQARERSNAQWKENAQRGRDRAETVQEDGKRKAYGHSKGKHGGKHGEKLKGKEKKWKDKAGRERDELEDREGQMKENGKKMGDDAEREAEKAKRKVSESVDQSKESASAAGEDAKTDSEAILKEAQAAPKGEARGFWSRFFGLGGDSE